MHDELRYFDLYDFGKFEEENPVVSEILVDDQPVTLGQDGGPRDEEAARVSAEEL